METVKGERKFQGMASTLRLIWREEGVKGYFKGNGTNVMRIVPYVAVQFAAYEEYKKVYNYHTLYPTVLSTLFLSKPKLSVFLAFSSSTLYLFCLSDYSLSQLHIQ